MSQRIVSSSSSIASLALSDSSLRSDSIQTFLRIRAIDKVAEEYKIFDNILTVSKKHLNKNLFGKSSFFSFTRIFDRSSKQLDVFDHTTFPLVVEFLNGFNNLIFTYGITSAGKSYTIRGTEQDPGLIPRALFAIFYSLKSHTVLPNPTYIVTKFCDIANYGSSQEEQQNDLHSRIFTQSRLDFADTLLSNIDDRDHIEEEIDSAFSNDQNEYECSVWTSFFQIYNEKVYDLLDSSSSSPISVVTTEKNFYLNNVNKVLVRNESEAMSVFLSGQENLNIKSTKLNESSSRSHSIFTISLVRTLKSTGESSISTLYFADLAGIERMKKIDGQTQALETETKKINNSLMVLGRCIAALKSKKASTPVPYRESMLTKVLQPFMSSIGGRMTLIYALNPSSYLLEESLYSLDFCNASKQVAIQEQEKIVRQLDQAQQFQQSESVSLKLRTSIRNLEIRNSNEDLKAEIAKLNELVPQLDKEREEKNKFLKLYMELLKSSMKKEREQKDIHQEQYNTMFEKLTSIVNDQKEKIRSLEEKLFETDELHVALEATYTETLATLDEMKRKVEYCQQNHQNSSVLSPISQQNPDVSEDLEVPAKKSKPKRNVSKRELVSMTDSSNSLVEEKTDENLPAKRPKGRKNKRITANALEIIQSLKKIPKPGKKPTRSKKIALHLTPSRLRKDVHNDSSRLIELEEDKSLFADNSHPYNTRRKLF